MTNNDIHWNEEFNMYCRSLTIQEQIAIESQYQKLMKIFQTPIYFSFGILIAGKNVSHAQIKTQQDVVKTYVLTNNQQKQSTSSLEKPQKNKKRKINIQLKSKEDFKFEKETYLTLPRENKIETRNVHFQIQEQQSITNFFSMGMLILTAFNLQNNAKKLNFKGGQKEKNKNKGFNIVRTLKADLLLKIILYYHILASVSTFLKDKIKTKIEQNDISICENQTKQELILINLLYIFFIAPSDFFLNDNIFYIGIDKTIEQLVKGMKEQGLSLAIISVIYYQLKKEILRRYKNKKKILFIR